MRHARAKIRASGGRAALLTAAAGIAGALSGCTETDSWLVDPSVIGRWEHTPTTVPVLSRIHSIEGPGDEWVEQTDPTPADLIPELTEYRIGPGDRLAVRVFDIPDEGRFVDYERFVDTRGFIEIPQLGPLNLGGQTSQGAADVVKAAMKQQVAQPLASVDVLTQHQSLVSVFGAVQNVQQYVIPTADYKLLNALTAAGGFAESADYIYVIRQIPLSESTSSKPKAARPGEGDQPTTPPSGTKINELIDELVKPKEPPGAPKPEAPRSDPKPGGSPGVMQPAGTAQPTKPSPPPIDLLPPAGGQAPSKPAEQPPQPEADAGDSTWVFLNGRWVKVKRPGGQTPVIPAPEAIASQPAPATPLVTQRVIRIPTARLANGDARVNIVIRPGDVIRVPPGPSGVVFVTGQVNRVGTYQMSQGLTVKRVIAAAGGLSAIAVPERTEIIRMVGNDREGMVRVDLRAIAEGTEPDVYLKSNDMINVGTSFWATPMAVVRNGFRFTYGFGFLADRNFGNDIFGAPPTNQFGQ